MVLCTNLNTRIVKPNPDFRCALDITLAYELRLRPDRAYARPDSSVLTPLYRHANSHALLVKTRNPSIYDKQLQCGRLVEY